MDVAGKLAEIGIKIMRAGVWKPRTKPGGFEGMGKPALEWLAKAKAETGMMIATEVATPDHLRAALDAGVDLLWIGARTSANPFAMQELADAFAAIGRDLPVLIKNPVNPDLELWVGALQRIYNAGIRRLGAIHRGFSAYGRHLYRNLPQWPIPIELRRRYPSLPIISDPSHIGGKRQLVAPLAQQALDLGFDGLIIESHCHPEAALSDAAQQVTPCELQAIISSLIVRNESNSAESLSAMRQEIDRLDAELLEVLAKRMQVARDIGAYKKDRRMPILQTVRYDDIVNSRVKSAQEMGMSAEFMSRLLSSIHEESIRQQIEVFNSHKH